MEIAERDIALLEASKSGTLLQLKMCLEDFVCDINCHELVGADAHILDFSKGGTRKTALHHSVERSKSDAVEYLLKKGAKPHIPDKNEETAFQAALRIADASVLSKFLAKGALKASPADLEAALFYCAKANHCNGLKIWLEAVKASGKPPSSSSSKLGSGSGEWNALNLNCKGEFGRTPLHVASASGHKGICEILLNYGADINVKDSEGQNALFSAIRFKRCAVMQVLISRGIAVEHRNKNGFTALHNACAHGDDSELKTITPFFEDPVAKPVDVMAIKDHEGHTALFSAAKRYQVETLKYLIQKRKADANAVDVDAQNMLHYIASYYEENAAKRKAQVQAVTTLLRLGCQWGAMDTAKRTPLMYACMCGNSDVVRVLLHNVDSDSNTDVVAFLSIADIKGNTALHLALSQPKNGAELLRQLLAYNISIDVRNKDGKTPLDLCGKDAELKATLLTHHERISAAKSKQTSAIPMMKAAATPVIPPAPTPAPAATPLNTSDRTPPTTPPPTPPAPKDSDSELSVTDKSGSEEEAPPKLAKKNPIPAPAHKVSPPQKRPRVQNEYDINDPISVSAPTAASYIGAATYIPPSPQAHPSSPYVNMRGEPTPAPAPAPAPAQPKQVAKPAPALLASSASVPPAILASSSSSDSVNMANLGVLIDHSELVLGDTIGEGAFGSVRKAEWLAGGLNVVAVKVLHKADPKAIQMFYKEVELMSKVRHPNIVQYYGACITPPLCMVMRFLPDSLMQLIARQLPSPPQLLSIASGIAKGLCYLHRLKIIHRDLKPSNILLDEHQTAYIADFGVSREYLSAATMTGIGTPLYMAPEVICSKKYGEKVDQYAFAMILWQMLTGKSVAKGFALRETDEELSPIQIAFKAAIEGVRPQIPALCSRPLAQLIISCWDANPDKRPPFDAVIGLISNMQKELSSGGLKRT